jgi:hypothetical protein
LCALSDRSGTTAGGGSGGVFSRFEMMYFPRNTGDVRLATDVIDRMLAWPSKPCLLGSVTCTRRKRDRTRRACRSAASLIDEGVVGIEQRGVQNGSRARRSQEQLRLATECLTHVVIEVGDTTRRPADLVQIAELQPLSGEVVHQARRSADPRSCVALCAKHAWRSQPPGDGEIEQSSSGMLLHMKNDRRFARSSSRSPDAQRPPQAR